MARPVLARPAGVLLLIVAAACGSDTTQRNSTEIDSDQARTALIHSFFATPSSIVAGGELTLSWKTVDVASLVLTDGGDTAIEIPADQVAVGTTVVRPVASTRYTLTGQAVEGVHGPVWRSVDVTVIDTALARPTIEDFTVSPDRIRDGEEVTLSWRTTGATALVLKDDLGGEIDLAGESFEDGEVTVPATQHRRRFVLTAVNPAGRATAEVQVELLFPPLVTSFFTLPHDPVEVGGETTLHWETARADRVRIVDDLGAAVVDTTEQLSGSLTLRLDRTATYTITASGEGGTSQAVAMARVAPTIELFTAAPRVVRVGDPVDVSWRVHGADAAVITGPGGVGVAIDAARLAEGSERLDVLAAGDFVITATRAGVPRSWSVFVELTEAPRVRSFVVDESMVTAAPDHPATVNLSWVQDGGARCTVTANNVELVERTPCERLSTLPVQVTEPTVFRLTAINDEGSHSATVQVDSVEPARIPVFTRSPTRRLTPGDTVSFSWEVTGAVSVRLEKNGLSLGIPATAFVGTTTDVVDFDSAYALIAENSLGHPTVAELAVAAGAPVIGTFESTPPVGAPGDTVTLDWACDGGTRIQLFDPADVELFSSTDLAAIDDGNATVVLPATSGVATYRLRVTNGIGGFDEELLPIQVSDGPIIRTFAAARTAITRGESVTLSWIVTDDPTGGVPNLALEDQAGNSYALGSHDPNAGSATITPLVEGTNVFTLTATTPGTTPSSATVEIEVGVPPLVDTFVADPAILSTEGGTVSPPVTLSWTTQNGVALSLWELDASGATIPPALRQLGAAQLADIASGTHVVHPQATTTYLIRVINSIGSVVERTVKVVVDPPLITSFTAAPVEIVAGEYSTLTWTTENATAVELAPREPTTYDRSFGFVDASVGGTQVQFTSNYNTYAVVTFPAGFTFPYHGVARTGVRMSTSGYLSFDLASTANNTSNYAFPYATYGYVHLAPYWDYLDGYSTGTAWWTHGTEAATNRQYVVLMWKNWSYKTTTAPTDLNFEVILWEDGVFEYRYGTMWGGNSSSGTSYQYYADGRYATIGFQNTSATWGWTVLDKTDYPGGLSNRGWAFDMRTDLNYAREVNPSASRTYTLTASNADGQVDASVDVVVHPKVDLAVAQVVPSGPEAGTPFEIRWKTSPATRVVVKDAQGAVLCTVTDPAQVAEGACVHTEPHGGSVSYTVEATNVLPQNVTSRTINAYVFPRLSIDASNVSAEFVTAGTQVTFTWQTTGALDAYLDLCVPKTNHGSCTPIDISSQGAASGSFTTTLTESREFWFRIYDGIGRGREVSHPVWVDAPELTSFTASSTQVTAGTPVTFSWSSTGENRVTIENGPAFREVTGLRPYLDLSAAGQGGVELAPAGGSTTTTYYSLQFPAGFSFPWRGIRHTGAQIFGSGWLTFDTTYTSAHTSNYGFPYPTYPNVELAPWWDYLAPGTNGKIYWALKSDALGDFLVIQWKQYTYSGQTSNLNFEVILRPDGAFEYRYGSMTSSSANYSNGYYATVGWQTKGAATGFTLFDRVAISGGISNRSFEFPANLAGQTSITLTPEETTTYELCVTNASLYEDCETIVVQVIHPGDVLVSELMIAPASDEAEWIELRNTSVDPIELDGWNLASGTETFAIPADADLVIPPGGFVVLARSADPAVHGGVDPDLVYGTAIQLADAGDSVSLSLGGVLVDEVTWTGTWPIQANRSIALEPSEMERAEGANDAASKWCAGQPVYGGGFSGTPGALGAGCLGSGALAWYVIDPVAHRPFIDVSVTGLDLSAMLSGTPYYTAPIPLGFTFPYFGDEVTEVSISRYGYLSLAPTSGYDSTNEQLPSATDPDGMIAPFWDSQNAAADLSSIQYENVLVGGQKVFVAQWTQVAPSSASYGRVTFQAQLWENGDIVYAYQDFVQSGAYPEYQYWRGSGSTIGIEDLAGTVGHTIFHGTTSTAGMPLYEGRVIVFDRR